jgi:hypothetical protein
MYTFPPPVAEMVVLTESVPCDTKMGTELFAVLESELIIWIASPVGLEDVIIVEAVLVSNLIP